MSDLTRKEELLFAAKAMDLHVIDTDEDHDHLIIQDTTNPYRRRCTDRLLWDPFTYAEDCMSMEIKLQISLTWPDPATNPEACYVQASSKGKNGKVYYATAPYRLFDTIELARMHASTSVAVLIGRTLDDTATSTPGQTG